MIKRFFRKCWRKLFAPNAKALLLIRRGEPLSGKAVEGLSQWAKDNRVCVHFCHEPNDYRLVTLTDKPAGEIMQADTEVLRELVGGSDA